MKPILTLLCMSILLGVCMGNNLTAVCTMDYNPVCGSKQVQCIQAPCPPVTQTYANHCLLSQDGANFISSGACNTDPRVGQDRDMHGCIGSAGYTWSQSEQTCVRVRESQASTLAKAYDFAYNHGITTITSLDQFRPDSHVTRQEAAKMFVAFWETIAGKKDTDSSEFAIMYLQQYADAHLFDPSLSGFVHQARVYNIMQGYRNHFMPLGTLTQAQSLVILMRIVEGRQDETVKPWWFAYSEQAHKLGYIALKNHNDMEKPIRRGLLIQWMYQFDQHMQ